MGDELNKDQNTGAGDENKGNGSNQNGGQGGDQTQNSGQANNNGNGVKTFTQDEVNAMMAREKNQGRAAVLRELGITDVKVGKQAVSAYHAFMESQMTDEERAAAKGSSNKSGGKVDTAADDKMFMLEVKLEVFQSGVKSDLADDVTALVVAKVNANKDMSVADALKEIKAKHKSFFGESSDDGSNDDGKGKGADDKGAGSDKGKDDKNKGTGNNVGSKKAGQFSTEGIGARLAAQTKPGGGKSSYFGK